MKKNIKYIIAIIFILIFTFAGLFLPEWITAYSDQNIIGKVNFEPFKFPQIISNNTEIINKIRLLKDYPQDVNKVELSMGVNFDLNSISNKCFEELSILSNLGILTELNLENEKFVKIDVSLYVQKDDPLISGVFWNINLQQDEFSGNFYMDDHTGKIIQFVISTLNKPKFTEKEIINTWSEYLGLEVQNIKSRPRLSSESESSNIFETGFHDYYFEFKYEDMVLPYIYYTFDSGYGFGYIMIISNYNSSDKINLNKN